MGAHAMNAARASFGRRTGQPEGTRRAARRMLPPGHHWRWLLGCCRRRQSDRWIGRSLPSAMNSGPRAAARVRASSPRAVHLRNVIARIGDHPISRIGELLPWNIKLQADVLRPEKCVHAYSLDTAGQIQRSPVGTRTISRKASCPLGTKQRTATGKCVSIHYDQALKARMLATRSG